MTVKEMLNLVAAGTPCRLVVDLPGHKFWTSQFAENPSVLHTRVMAGAPDYLEARVVNVDATSRLDKCPYLIIYAEV